MTPFGRFRAFACLFVGALYRRQPLASLLSLSAVALAAGMVLRVACLFSAVSDRLDALMADASAHFDLVLAGGEEGMDGGPALMDGAIATPHPALPDALLDLVRGHGGVESSVVGSVATVEVYPGGGRRGGGGKKGGGGGLQAAEITDPMFRMAGWMPGEMAVCPLFSPEEGAVPPGVGDEAWKRCVREGTLAVPSSLARQFGLAEGAEVFLAGAGGRTRARVGSVYPTGGAGDIRGLFPVCAPDGVFTAVAGGAWRPNRAYLRLRGSGGKEFGEAFSKAAADSGAAAALLGPGDWRKAALPVARGRPGAGFDAIPYSAVFLANMAALFLLLSTLAVNVQGQRRELAVLRAVGAPSWMPAAAVLLQGFGLALPGWALGAGLGLRAFRATLPAASRGWPHVLAAARGAIALSAVPILVGALLACIPAVWMLARMHPLEAAQAGRDRAAGWRRAFAAGLAALLAHPLLAWTPLARGPLAQGFVLPAAYLLAMAGAVLMVPGTLRALARALAEPLGALLRLHPLLLRDHAQDGLWQQTLGCAALLVSLSFYLTTAVWGESMRRPFVASGKAPDAIAMFLPNGPLPEHAGKMASLPGVASDCAMRLAHLRLEGAASGDLEGKIFAGRGELILVSADLPAFLACIGHRVVAGHTGPLGDGECVVMEQMPLADPRAFRIGRPFGVYPLEEGGGAGRGWLVPVGVLDIPGWQLITKSTRMRRGMNRTLSLVFVNDATFDRFAPRIRENCHWLGLAPGADMQALQDALDALRPFPGAYVKLTDVAGAQAMVNRRSDSVIAPLLRLPLLVLGLSSLAVLVSLAAAAWSRRHAYALLAALGLSRAQLVRLLLGEALLLGAASLLLGTVLALLFSETGILLCNRMMTVRAPWVFPLRAFATGAAATFGSVLLGALLAIPLVHRRSGPASALAASLRP